MKKLFVLSIGLFLSLNSYSQWVESPMASCEDPAFNRKVNKVLNYTVDVISVEELKNNLDQFTVLDTRELKEYLVSHIPGAEHMGYDNPKWDKLSELAKDTPIVVYCSIGYRSEKIGEQLKKQGFTKVRNLYGSIFEWSNQGYELQGPKGVVTKRVHTYNKKWSKWVLNEFIEKVY